MNLREARQAIRAVMQATWEPNANGTAEVKRIDFGKCGAVIKGEVISVAHRTYGGVPAWSWTVRERGQWGRRTHYVWWLADAEHTANRWPPGTLVANTVTGNPSKGTFLQLATTHEIEVEGLKLS
jgi:hypothetical protein